jgi:hypothetical protein
MLNWTETELAERLAKNPALRINPRYSSRPKSERGKSHSIAPVQPVMPEEYEQERTAELLDGLGVRWFHVPNGGKRHVAVAVKLKKAGVKAGAPDIFIFTPPPAFPDKKGTVIELKRRIGGTVSDEQEDWLEALNDLGWYTAVCRGYEEAEKVLRECGYIRS